MDQAASALRAPWSPVSAVTARRWARDLTHGLALVWWATALTWGWGGREPRVLSFGLLLTLGGVLLGRSWRVLHPIELVLVLSVAFSPLLVLATSPTGWAGASDAASYAYAALTYILVRGWTADRTRLLIVLALVAAAGSAEFAKGWLAWWGSADQTAPFQGTFYWHNQVGVFLACGALAAFGLLAVQESSIRPLVWVTAPLCSAGVAFTTSRGSQLGLAAGFVVLVALCAVGPNRSVRLVRLTAAGLLSFGAAWLLSGPPFFAERMSASAGTVARGQAESLSGNSDYRLEFWGQSWQVFTHWPVTGAGFHSFGSATAEATGTASKTAFVHNGFLQGLADGGLVLALPLFTGALLLAALVLRRTFAAAKRGDTLAVTAAVCLALLMLHSGMDFDWTYPSLLALTAVLAAATVSALGSGSPGRPTKKTDLVVVAVLILVVGVGVVGAWAGGLDLNSAVVAAR